MNSPNLINLILNPGRGDCSVASKEATTGERVPALPVAHRKGYTFEGWFTAPGNDGVRVGAGDLLTFETDTVLYARYTKKKGAAAKKKKSTYRLQKQVLIALLCSIVVLSLVLVGVNYLVSIIPYTDYDGAVYKAKKVDGVYAMFDSEGNRLPQNEDGYYLTVHGTQLEVDPDTGAVEEFAVVYVEGMEEPGAGQRILMFAQIRQTNVMSIEVTKGDGTSFRIYNADLTNESKNIVVEGYESGEYLVSYDKEKYAYLCVAAGYPLTLNKLPNDRVAELGYAEYGLVAETRVDENGNEYEYVPTQYTIVGALRNADDTLKKNADGTAQTISHTVIVGDPIVGGGGYYCKMAGDENKSVYIMNNDNYDQALLQPIESLITPVITYPTSLTMCTNVENFYLATCNDGNRYDLTIDVAFDYIDLTMRTNTMYSTEPYQTGSGYQYQYGGYRLHGDRLSTILQLMYSPTIQRICKLGVHTESGSPDLEVLADYGLDKPYKIMSYDMQLDSDNNGIFDGVIENELWISQRTENKTYYVYSVLCDVVAEVAETSFYFAEYSALDWINPYVIWHSLAYLKTLDIVSPTYNASMEFDNSASDQSGTVNSQNITFTINGVTPDYIIQKTAAVTGRVTEETPVYNLRQFYKTLLSLTVAGDVRVGNQFTLTDEEMAQLRALDDTDPRCQLVISMDFEDYAKQTNPDFYPKNNVSQLVFRFYRLSDGRSYMTINGEGEFYVDGAFVDKIIADAQRLEKGILIDSTAKN